MRATFKLCNPDEMEATVNVTMTVSEWRELREQMIGGWPSWKFKEAISDVIRQAEKVFYTSVPSDEAEREKVTP